TTLKVEVPAQANPVAPLEELPAEQKVRLRNSTFPAYRSCVAAKEEPLLQTKSRTSRNRGDALSQQRSPLSHRKSGRSRTFASFRASGAPLRQRRRRRDKYPPQPRRPVRR